MSRRIASTTRSGSHSAIPVKGGTYQGEWKDTMRHGHGKMTYSDKRVYEGEWERDLRHGFGTLTYPAKKGAERQYAGEWV